MKSTSWSAGGDVQVEDVADITIQPDQTRIALRYSTMNRIP